MIPDEAVKLDIRAAVDAELLDPAASPLKLLAGQDCWFHVEPGSWKIQVSAA